MQKYKEEDIKNPNITIGKIYDMDEKIYTELVTLKSIIQLKEKVEDEQKTFKNNTGNNILFSSLIDQWLDKNDTTLKAATKYKYQELINKHILPFIGDMNVSDITSKGVNDFISMKLKNGRLDGNGGLSSSYVRSIAIILSSLISFGVQEGLCKPLKSPIVMPIIKKREFRVLTFDEQKRLETYLKNNISATNIGILLSLYTGLRIGEICALSWEDINFHSNTLHVNKTVSRIQSKDYDDKIPQKTTLVLDAPKTYSSNRIIPISSTILPIIISYRDSSTSPFIVSNNNLFVSPRTYESRFHQVLLKCGISNINFHALRHTFATRCVEAGVDIKSLSEILGHTSVTITLNTYVHSSLEQKRAQLEKLVFSN